MDKKVLDYELRSSEAFVLHVASVFDDAEGNAAPLEGGFTVAQQLAHIAHTVHWFDDGAVHPTGFDMDFAAHHAAILATKSLADARDQVKSAYAAMRAWLANSADAELAAPLPDGPIMPGIPKFCIVLGVIDHTAHHRGTLSAYARALGKTPPMPYEAQVSFEG